MKLAAVSNLFVVAMGLGVVFIGLICIVFLCMLTSYLCRLSERKKQAEVPEEVNVAPVADEIPNRGEWIAAVSAAIAEDLGTDLSAIRILSVKRV